MQGEEHGRVVADAFDIANEFERQAAGRIIVIGDPRQVDPPQPKAAPGGQDGQSSGRSAGGIDAGEPGGGDPPRRLSGGRCGRSRRQSCAARCRRRSRCRARCAAKPAPADARVHRAEPEAKPAAGAAAQGERGEFCDERDAKRRHEENEASVTHRVRAICTACRLFGKRSAQRASASGASVFPVNPESEAEAGLLVFHPAAFTEFSTGRPASR